ncbi:MAG: twin-arginine translocase subunit TatC [Candidatus Bathyarchaeia archaeon]
MSSDAELPLWDHLEELIRRLRIILFSVIISSVVISILPTDLNFIHNPNLSDYRPLLSLIIEEIQNMMLPKDVNLIALNWVDTFYIYVLIAIVLGTLVSTPVIAFEFYKFLSPALLSHERRALITFMISFSILFIGGAAYACLILLPITFKTLMRFVYSLGVIPYFAVKDFFEMVFIGIVGSGLFFTLPLFIAFLVKMEVIDPEILRKNRGYILVGLLIVTAIITPDPTPLSMLLISIPFYLLYELSILIGIWIKNKVKQK